MLRVEKLIEFSDKNESVFIFEISNGKVNKKDKADNIKTSLIYRDTLYERFFQEVVTKFNIKEEFVMAVNVRDEAFVNAPVPVFSFQKTIEADDILMPDVDFLDYDFYYKNYSLKDDIQYDEKKCSAIFVGGTTGGDIVTKEKIDKGQIPRLEAAEYFRDSEDVDFRITSLVQCDGEDTENYLRQLGYGTERISWQEQFKHKFVISMDGNGATCSRVVIALRSNSVLLKYNSPHQLYYFSLMKPWVHYIPIHNHQNIADVIDFEKRNPGAFKRIAEHGQQFAEQHLTKDVVQKYMADIMKNYAQT